MAGKPLEQVAFARLGQSGASTPLVIAVPHAGRLYPAEMLAATRLPREALETIEDRYADLMIAEAVQGGAVAIVARMARAYVDLNRDEREIDPAILQKRPAAGAVLATSKVTGGLGVIPSRIAAGGAVWRHPLPPQDVTARIEEVHRPYHAAIADALAEAQARHGVAILLDCHSMPPLEGTLTPAQIVIGDRYGRSAAPAYVEAAAAAARSAGLSIARNHPYAGGHTLDRHGRPRQGRHALQIEIDRSLYLDKDRRDATAGLAHIRAAVASIAAALIDQANGFAEAAE
jgi:N-formylglutamate amidohydrolase